MIKNRGVDILSENPEAVDLIENHLNVQDKVGDRYISRNPQAIHFLEANPEYIDWVCLSSNPNAVQLLEKNIEKIKIAEILKKKLFPNCLTEFLRLSLFIIINKYF